MASKTWTDTSGDWSVATLWNPAAVPTSADSATLASSGSYDVTVGALSTTLESVGSLLIDDPLADLAIEFGSTLAVGGTLSLTSGELDLDGTLSHATLLENGGSFVASGSPGALAPAFNGVTIAGALTESGGFGGSGYLAVSGGLGFTGSGGVGAGTLSLVGAYDSVTFLDNETLTNAVIVTGAARSVVLNQGTTGGLTLGSTSTLEVGGAGISLLGSFVNRGTIAVAAGAALTVAAASFTNAGVLQFAAGSTLDVLNATNAQLLALANAAGAQGETVELTGTFANGTSLLSASGALANLEIAGAVRGGTIVAPAGSDVIDLGGSLVGLTYDGAITVPQDFGFLALAGGVTFAGAGGAGPGTIVITGPQAELSVAQGSLDNVAILPLTSEATILGASYGSGALSLGSHVTLTTAGYDTLEASTLRNAGTLSASGIGSGFELVGSAIVNTGTIAVSGGGTLDLALGAAALGVTNTGSISVGAGGTIIVGGAETTAQLLALLGTIIAPGLVTVELDGTLINSGTSIVAGAGALIDNLILDGDIIGGAVVDTGENGGGNAVSVIGGTLDGVTFDGAATVPEAGAQIDVLDGLTLDQVSGAAGGTLLVTGGDDFINFTSLSLSSGTVVLAQGDDGFGEFGGSLTLGAGVELIVGGAGNTLPGTTLTNAGSISVLSGELDIAAQSLANNGVISAAPGAAIGLGTGLQFGAALTLSGTGSVRVAPLGTLVVGDTGVFSAAQLAGLLTGDLDIAVVLDADLTNAGSILTIGTASPIGALALGTAGDVEGGVIQLAAGGAFTPGGTLAGVTFDGPLAFAGIGDALFLSGGFTLDTAAGLSNGTLLADGDDGVLDVLDSETLGGFTLDVTDPDFTLEGNPALTLAGSLIANVAGVLTVQATTLSNAGTITLSVPGAQLALAAPTIRNTGIISIGSGDVLAIDAPGGHLGPLAFTNSGQFTMAAGATIELGGTYTPTQLQAVAALGGPGVEIVLQGTLLNTGNTLVAAGGLSDLQLEGEIVGGTISVGTGTVVDAGADLSNLVFQGPLVLADGPFVDQATNVTLQGANGSLPGTLIAGTSQLDLSGTTLDNLLIEESGGLLSLDAAGSLALGAHLSVVDAGQVAFFATTISNAASLAAISSNALLAFDAPDIVNTGTIQAGFGAELAFDLGTNPAPLSLINSNLISVAAGGTLALGGLIATGSLVPLVSTIINAGVLTVLTGTIVNTGTTLSLSGVLDDVDLSGSIVGGTVVAPTGNVVVGQTLSLAGVTYDGLLDIGSVDGSALFVTGGLVVNASNGTGPGTVELTGADAAIDFGDASDVLAGEVLLLSGLDADIQANNLTLAATSDAGVTGSVEIDGETFANAGSIAVSGSLGIESNALLNFGTISVGSTGTLQLGDVPGLLAFSLMPLDVAPVGSIALAAGATLAVGTEETTAALLALLGTIGTAAAKIVLDGTVTNTGATLAVNSGSALSNLLLDGTVIGGTIVAGTGSLTIGAADFVGVTFVGALDLGDLTVSDGLDVIPASGTLGLINSTGFGGVLSFADTETLDHVVVTNAGSSELLIEGSALTFGSSLTLAAGGSSTTTIDAANFVNDGTIVLAGSAASVFVGSSAFTNGGVIQVGASDVFGLDSLLGNAGSFVFAAGSTLDVAGSLTTAQLLTLLGTVIGTQTGVTVELSGEVVNTGTTLVSTAGGLLGNLILDATIDGGTISTGTGSVTVAGGNFSGVTYQGPLTLGTFVALGVSDGLTLETAAGGLPGTLAVTGPDDGVFFTDSETLANAQLDIGGTGFQLEDPADLTLAPSLSANITGQLAVSADALANGMNVALGVPGSAFLLDSDTITNSGTITAAAQTEFGIGSVADVSVLGTDLSAAPIVLTTTAPILLAAGVTLAIGGLETNAQIQALVGSLAPQAGQVILDGVVLNGGAVLAVPATGSLSHLLFDDAEVEGGTIAALGGSIGFADNDLLDGVTYDGPLILNGSLETSLEVEGGLNIVSPTGGAGTLSVGGEADLFLIGENQTLNGLVFSLGNASGPAGAEVSVDGTLVLGTAETITTAGTSASLFSFTGLVDNEGTIADAGTLTLGTFVQLGNGSVTDSTFVNAGTIAALAGSHLQLDGNFVNTGTVLFGPGGTLTVDTPFISNTGRIVLTGGALANFTAGAIEPGTTLGENIGGNFTLPSFVGAPVAAGVIDVSAGGETVAYSGTLIGTGAFAAELLGFDDGDIFDLSNVIDSSAVRATFSVGTLSVTNGSDVVASLILGGTPAYAQSDFTVQADARGDAEVVSSAPCFCAGTHILTAAGLRAVEDLAVGDQVVTRSGTLAPIVWIGQLRVDLRRHPRPELVRPVRIRADAFAAGVPARDLRLSPDHAVFVADDLLAEGGALVPARYLVNAATVVEEADAAQAHYFHVELAAHDVLFAEGLPVESYLDTGNRGQFADAPVPALHPDFSPRSWHDACAPLCLSGPVLTRLRAELLSRAATLGYVRAAGGLWLECAGRRMRAVSVRAGMHSFSLPAGTRAARIVTPSAVPAELDPDSSDRRRLGAAIGGVVANGRNLPLDGPVAGAGFHAPEAAWRWTTGDAWLELARAGVRGPVVLDILVRRIETGWALAHAPSLAGEDARACSSA